MKSIRLSLLLLLFSCGVYAEDPWGLGSEIAYSCSEVPRDCTLRDNPLIGLSEVLIGFHQEVISPADGPRSHFLPSSSQYTKEAIQKYGFLTGFWMGCDRLMRENDEEWVYRTTKNPAGKTMKFNPVP